MQHKISQPHPLLNEHGVLIEAGYDTSLTLSYERKTIKAPWFRIKEGDYYFIANEEFGIAITVADYSYMGLDSITLFDFKSKNYITKNFIQWLPRGNKALPTSSIHGDTRLVYDAYQIEISHKEDYRIIDLRVKQFKDKKDLVARLILKSEPKQSMVNAISFNNPKHFCLTQKINCLRVEGSISLGHDVIRFQPANTFGVLNWGRGAWSNKNTWYWGSASGLLHNHSFGFNLAYGLGNTTKATENMILYQGKVHKLENVSFQIPLKEGNEVVLENWTITSDDQRFEMMFEPILDYHFNSKSLFHSSTQHQIFGYFSGKVMLDDGEILTIKRLFGFCEKITNNF